MTNYAQMSDEDLNRLVAERVMCLRVQTAPTGWVAGWVDVLTALPSFIGDISAAWRMEDRLGTLGKRFSSHLTDHPRMMYTVFLMEEVGLAKGWRNGTYTGNPHDFWALLRATPRQRSIAALRAVESQAEGRENA